MPGFNIHIAIGNEYLKKNKIKNIIDFKKGVVFPDLCSDKAKSHFSKPIDKNNLINSLKNKVDLVEFIKSSDINDDFNKGVFLHLITDYYFYNHFFSKSYLEKTDWEKFKIDLYYSLDQTDSYIKNKYNINYDVLKKEIEEDFNKYKNFRYPVKVQNIINTNKLDDFIYKISLINLDDIKEKIEV